jgi:uncharacterized protein YjbJ (UPF0337 family)
MSTETAQKEWTELKGKIKTKWDKLVETDLEKFRGNMHLVAARVQNLYGITKDKAEQEYKDFQTSLQAKPEQAKPEVAKTDAIVTPIDKTKLS